MAALVVIGVITLVLLARSVVKGVLPVPGKAGTP